MHVPKEAVIDPEIMLSMPAYVTAATGFDVFVHIFEAFTEKQKMLFLRLTACRRFIF
jgi:Alcohol dehydrogenase, class IV